MADALLTLEENLTLKDNFGISTHSTQERRKKMQQTYERILDCISKQAAI